MPRRNPRPRTPGSLGNRTDLTAANLPTGQPYGARTDQARALSLAPAQPTPPPAPITGAPDPIAAAQAQPFSPIGLGDPTQRPGEPVTAGLPIGAGPGPPLTPPQPQGPNPDVLLYAKWMPALELLANSPTASSETRQFYRRLRSQMPVSASPSVQAGNDQLRAAAGAQGIPAPSAPPPASTPPAPAPAPPTRY